MKEQRNEFIKNGFQMENCQSFEDDRVIFYAIVYVFILFLCVENRDISNYIQCICICRFRTVWCVFCFLKAAL